MSKIFYAVLKTFIKFTLRQLQLNQFLKRSTRPRSAYFLKTDSVPTEFFYKTYTENIFREKCPNTDYLPVFSPNTGKYTIHMVIMLFFLGIFLNMQTAFLTLNYSKLFILNKNLVIYFAWLFFCKRFCKEKKVYIFIIVLLKKCVNFQKMLPPGCKFFLCHWENPGSQYMLTNNQGLPTSIQWQPDSQYRTSFSLWENVCLYFFLLSVLPVAIFWV